MEERILEKLKLDFRSEMEVMRNDIMRAIASLLRNVSTKYDYVKVVEDFKFGGSIGEDKTN